MKSITERLAWKETALLRPICISCLALLAIILVAGALTLDNSRDFTEFAGNLVMGIGCVTALACGILMFVFERESGTDSFLESLPVDGRQIAKTKLLQTGKYFLLYSACGILLGMAALAIYDGGIPTLEGKAMPDVWVSMIILVPIQCLLWSMICSIVFRSGLHATIASAGLTVASFIGLGMLSNGWIYRLNEQNDLYALVAIHSVVCLLLCGAIWHLSPRWLRGNERTTARTHKSSLASATSASPQATRCAYPLRSLTWQSMRRCWVPWLIAGIGLLIGSKIVESIIQYSFIQVGDGRHVIEMASWSQGLFVIAGAWIGMMMFSGDQSKSSFLFFQHHADYPRRVWFSRLVILILFLPVVVVAALLAAPYIPGWWYSANLPGNASAIWINKYQSVVSSIVVFLAAAGLAQLATMVFRAGSGFVAFIVTVALCVVLFVCYGEISGSNGSAFVFVGPLAITCFAASWWLAPRWISGRKQITGAIVAFLSCGLVAAVLFCGWVWHRVNEFEVPQRSLQWTAFMEPGSLRANEDKFPAAVSLREAIKNLQAIEDESLPGFPAELTAEQSESYFSKNEDVFGLISKSLEDSDCGLFLDPRSHVERENQKTRLQRVLEAATNHHIQANNTEQAFNSLVDELRSAWWVGANREACEHVLTRVWEWSSTEGNEEQLIRDAIQTFDDLERSIFDSESEFLYRESVLEVERRMAFQKTNRGRGTNYSWEIERSRRWHLMLLDRDREWRKITDPSATRTYSYSPHAALDPPDQRIINVGTQLSPYSIPRLARLRNLFRYTRVRLALAGWKLKHGAYPKKLGELSEGEQPWLDAIPVSIFSGREFAYSDSGLDDRVFFSPEQLTPPFISNYRRLWNSEFDVHATVSNAWIEAEQPFLLPWSGVVGQKRPLVREVYDKETDETRRESETEYAWWIPTGRANNDDFVEKYSTNFVLD